MSRTNFALALTAVTLALATGCQRNGEAAGITTIRSGTPGGARVTSAPEPASDAKSRAASRLAAAVCEHQRRCATTEGTDVSSEAALLGEAVCVADLEPRARRNVEAWRCSPDLARGGLEACLAAIRADEARCNELSLAEESEISSCRPSEICRRAAGISDP